MKKLIALLVVSSLVLSGASLAYAGDPVQKLGRGISNVAFSAFEIPKGMGDATEEKGLLAGATWGLLKGTVDFVKRAVVGVFEIGTFPLPVPKNYDPILKDPEYFLQDRKPISKT